MSFLFSSTWQVETLTEQWRRATPFPHVILDDLLSAEVHAELVAAVQREPHWPNRSDFYEMMGSALPVRHEALARFAAELGSAETLAAVAAMSGKSVRRVEMRSYVYLAASYLLPHYDRDRDLDRLVAYAYYLLPEGSCTGGELELFSCEVSDGEVRPGVVAKTITPRANRLVIFDVSDVSLHQVREVLTGARASLSGWYFR